MLVIPSTLESELAAGGTFSAKGLNRTAQTFHKKSGEPLMFRKFPMDGLADGKASRTAKAVEVVGTESYTTVLGAKKTVFVVEPFDLEKWQPVIKKKLRPAVGSKEGR